ncbi:MAG: NUDIX hydrolase [Planctomycetota bacterium]|nr:NUDIX hydrolase [Planctomycetota bacterium]
MGIHEPIENLGEGKFLRLLRRGRWEYAERTNTAGAAGLVAVTDDGRLLLVEQPRAALQKKCIELPAGLVGDEAHFAGEAFAQAARRELVEETGYEAKHIEPLCTGVATPGMSNEVITLFLATGLKRVSTQLGDGHEEITLHEVPLRDVDAWLGARTARGEAVDVKVYSGLYFLLRRGLFPR